MLTHRAVIAGLVLLWTSYHGFAPEEVFLISVSENMFEIQHSDGWHFHPFTIYLACIFWF
jgi:hypothetical protein